MGLGWSRESGGSFGEFELRNYLQLRLPGLRAATAAAGWVGDRYDVYTHADESVAVFRLGFVDEAQAEEFRTAQDELLKATGAKAAAAEGMTLATRPDGHTTARLSASGGEVIFAIGSNADATKRALQLLSGG